MVYKKMLEFGCSYNGVPRAPRSIRKRKKVVEEEKLCAFELLASVAGKLLQESEGSASHEGHEKKLLKDDKAFNSESFDRGSCDESVFLPEKRLQESDLNHSSQTVTDASEKLNCDVKLGASKEKSSKDSRIGSFTVGGQLGDISVANVLPVHDPVEGFVNTNSQVNSESSVKLPFYKEHCKNVKLGIRDDDEKLSGYDKYSVHRAFRPQPRIGHRRIRKMITSRYWKKAPKLKDYELCTTSDGTNTLFRCRKRVVYSRERFQEAPIKKRRLVSDHSTMISNMYGKVTVSIKSFKVPELYVEVPESATVGSLKRTVLDAVTAILGGGVCVGIFLQGKKVRDDNRSLQQAGISQCSNPDNLCFTLEPKPQPASFLCDASNPDTQKSLANNELNDAVPENMALVPISPMKTEALAAVPLNQKPKRSEVSQRRTRRPFSVAEVEALVEAVEKLGTGRWRDVKIRGFGNTDHRTYVDLKDKWKTLVHTASISPQQRRGEPVPHELLNRVLLAHSYWSLHQSKHQKLEELEPRRFMDSQEAP